MKGAAVLLVSLAGCIELVTVSGAFCPCPASHVCCVSLGVCRAPEESCPEAYPASSGDACTTDRDCPAQELCRSWSPVRGGAAPAGTCQRLCGAGPSCSDGEACELAPHDGKPLNELSTAWMCVGASGSPCASASCTRCAPENLGALFCDGSKLMACFVALDDACGLVCNLLYLGECPGGCGETVEPDLCAMDYNVCTDLACSKCDVGVDIGGTACVNDTLLTCASTPVSSSSCSEICLPTAAACPTGQVCAADGATACSP